ncbi:conserved hypothetical protein [uncultured delta proteobacterium]|uniref:Spore protein YkvP/CgeB glycosyl transferase-like domain-containing protein n=1 Tax=uncultured delta proteobacterium TaxID=34034 RepID=A0A212JLK2_9DELT|nr:conserved hypothetical protein [uncultured delta proteobacterium]
MHVLLLDPQYWFDFTALGHTVSAVPLTEYETPLEHILATLPAPPDCIIQQEQLGVRHFVTGLEHAPCPTLYLAFDAHLNLYWQQYYAGLFDAVLTPHRTLFEALPPENRHPQTFRLVPAGTDLPWVDHADRQHPLAFCGRITSARPLRKAMTGLLQNRFGLAVHRDMPPEAMFRFYQDARIIPNEAICFEVNMRLLEGASAGAALLTPDCGPDQLAAFTDGAEMLVYRDGLDLCEKASWLLRNPDKAETMGRTAWERVQREHLPIHRAAFVLGILPGLTQTRVTGRDAAVLTWLTRLERTQSGDLQYPASGLLSASAALPDTPEVLAGMLRLLGSPARKTPALEFCRLLLNSGTASLLRNATASACALTHGDLPLAQAFHARQFPPSPIPLSPAALCRAWATALHENGRTVRPGFAFRPEAGHLPACALEFLAFAKHLCPQERETLALEEAALLKPFPAYASYRLSLLKSLPPSGQNLDELADLLLFCCRVDEGLALREKIVR